MADSSVIINATNRTKIGKLSNHSWTPNARYVKYRLPHAPVDVVFLEATQAIAQLQEVLVDYGPAEPDATEMVICECNYANCRRYFSGTTVTPHVCANVSKHSVSREVADRYAF